jgi:2-haloacid dehalogenase
VTFDCYGTLVDWRAGLLAIVAGAAGDRAADVARVYDAYACEAEQERPQRTYKDVYVTALLRAAADARVPLSEADARFSLSSWSVLRPYDDTDAFLMALRQKGYRIGVLTNCDDDLFEITHRSFRTPFDLFVTAERIRGYKPAPWHFRAFELMTGVQKTNWVHVGSSWYHDVAPARELGIKHVWFDRESTSNARDRGTASVTDSTGLVAAIERLMCGQRHAGRNRLSPSAGAAEPCTIAH